MSRMRVWVSWHHARMNPSRGLICSRRAWLAAAAAAGGVSAFSAWAQQPPAGEAKARPLPPLDTRIELPVVPMLNGQVFDPARAQGQVLVLYWWASWCPFCAVQSPMMDQLWRAQRGRGLQMLGLSIDKKIEDAEAYMAKRGYVFPSGFVTPEVARALPKPKGLPITYVIGRDGRLLMAEAGQLFPEDVAQIANFL
jgi:thiol-disulfide isomerase/thioredoxin